MKNELFDLSKNYYYLVDTSYLIFVAAYISFKEFVYQNDIPKTFLNESYDPTLDPDFNYIFKDRFIAKIENTIKKFSPFTFNNSNFIFTMDCSRKDIWRRTIYPEYKLTRDTKDTSKDEFNVGKVFDYAYNLIIPNYCDETGSIIIRSSCAESDDIIAVLTKKLLNENENNFVIILSSDRDMIQLCNDRVVILTAQNEIRDPKKDLEIITKTSIEKDINADDFLLFKIMIGDSSDNIPSIKHRMGPKTALKYILDESKANLKNLLKEDIDVLKGFKRNKQLISMNEIPDYMVNSITEDINEAFKRKQK